MDRELEENRNKSWGSWLKKKAKGLFGQVIQKPTVFFSRKVLESRCKGLIDWVRQEHELSTIEESVLQSHLSVCGYLETEAKVILSYLLTQSKAASHTVTIGRSSKHIYKFRLRGEKRLEMTAKDYVILSVSAAKSELQTFISHLERQRDGSRSEVIRLTDSGQQTSRG